VTSAFQKIFAPLQVRPDKTRRFCFIDVEGVGGRRPYFEVLSATPLNKPFQAAKLERLREDLRMNMLETAREDDRELYPLFVVRDWGDWPDEKGEPIPFSPEACADCLRQMPDHLFDRLRIFADRIENFRDGAAPGLRPKEIEKTAGN
jgi:hypothetical protein